MSQLSTFFPLNPGPTSNVTFGSVTTGAVTGSGNATFGSIQNTPIGNTTPNSGAFTTLSANNGTLTASAPVLDLAQTWNDPAPTYKTMVVNVTNAGGSNAATNYPLEIQSAGTAVASIALDGRIRFSGTLATGSGTSWATWVSGSYNNAMNVNAPLIVLGSGGTGAGTAGVRLQTEGVEHVLALRNATNPQTFNIYNTFTNASNYERGFMRWSSNVLQIGTEKAGTGSARNLELVVDGTTRMIIDTSGQVGIGNGVSLNRPFHIYGTTAWGRIDRVGTVGPAWLMVRMSTGQTVASSWLFGPLCGTGSTVAGATDDDFAISDFGTAISGTAGTARLTISKSTGQLTVNGNLNLSTKDLVTDTTTGTKIATGTTQKLGFWNATPAVQPAAIADATDAASTQDRLNDLLATMRTLGLIAT